MRRWPLLVRNKCPDCTRNLATFYVPELKKFVCKCGFAITEARMEDLVSIIVLKKLTQREMDERYS